MVEGNGSAIVLYRIDPGTRFESHTHDLSELGVILAGEGLFVTEGGSRIVREGDSFFIPPGTRHGFEVPRTGGTVMMMNVTVPPLPDTVAHPASAVIRFAESVVKRGDPSTP
jgi:quercetin dioxygenase-like cupin family protein